MLMALELIYPLTIKVCIFFKIFVLLYADDTVILADNAEAFKKVLIHLTAIVRNGG